MGQRLDVTGTKWDTLGGHRVEPNIDWTENMNRTESVVKLKSFTAAFSVNDFLLVLTTEQLVCRESQNSPVSLAHFLYSHRIWVSKIGQTYSYSVSWATTSLWPNLRSFEKHWREMKRLTLGVYCHQEFPQCILSGGVSTSMGKLRLWGPHAAHSAL